MNYNVKKQCHVCHGHGVKKDENLITVTCKRCNGTGEPCAVKTKYKKATKKQNYRKDQGMNFLENIKPV